MVLNEIEVNIITLNMGMDTDKATDMGTVMGTIKNPNKEPIFK